MKFTPSTPQKKVAKPIRNCIAIDFDGVIHDYKHPIDGRRMGAPISGAKDALEKLKDKYEIVVFTVWGDEKGSETIANFMRFYDLPYDRITNIKPQANYYIDDKAVKFTNWKDIQI